MTAGTDPKTLVRRLIDDVWNTGDSAAADWLVDRIDRISGGRIVEHWASFDQLGLLQQLGAIPSGAAPGR